MSFDCATGLGTLRGNWPGLTLGGSKVNFIGNFKVKGKSASRVASQDSGGFGIFFVFFDRGKGENSLPTHVQTQIRAPETARFWEPGL